VVTGTDLDLSDGRTLHIYDTREDEDDIAGLRPGTCGGTCWIISRWASTFGGDTSTSRTGRGPVNLATIRAAIIAAIKDAGYLHVPEGRRDHTTPAEALRLHGLD
jgi:hypothetical protein